MYTISQLSRQVNLSRSTLLYYDRLGILRPSARSAAGYRLYNEDDRCRLERICSYRATGLPLERIRAILDSPDSPQTMRILEEHLCESNEQIHRLRRQQRGLI